MFLIPLSILIVLSIIALIVIIALYADEWDGPLAGTVALIIALLFLGPAWFGFGYSLNYSQVSNERTCKVQDVVKVNEFEQSTNGSRVYCEDGSNYEISDNFMTARFESSNVYNRVKAAKGKEIVVDTIGFRNGFFSSFENIVEVKEVK